MRENINFKSILHDINELISEGYNCVSRIEATSYNLSSANDYDDDEHNMEMGNFEAQLKKIYVSICLLLEMLDAPELLGDFKSGFNKYKGKLTNLITIPYIGEQYSEVLAHLWMYYRSISVLFDFDTKATDDSKERARLASILQNTAKVVYDRNILPSSEADVRRCVYDLLIHIFPDTVREIPIAQVTKTYKPDIGVRSLKTAAEYKYATTEQEAKKIIGGFYEDMRGYGGSEDWKHFYAVVYMTEPFFTLQQIQAEFEITQADKNWVPILVHGSGTRRRSKGETT
jgi:hypothetical protein